ncbi:MAG: DUF3187 family protein [Proteobacteria bacterium]|nr:DUF3187 family protein [Pseudomonadota bacterium]
MQRVSRALSGASALACLLHAASGHAEPLLTRNQHPLATLYGLPMPLAARLPGPGSGSIGGNLNWSNFATTDTTERRSYTLDGEVFEVRVQGACALGERFTVQGELAWRQLSGGSLDSLVESWHDLFGLPNGSRDRLPKDALLIEYRSGDSALLRVDDESSGLADLPLSLGYQLAASERGAVATWLTIKLPTGKAENLTGSGAVDVALSLAGERQLSERWQLFGQVNVAWLGNGDVLTDLQQDFAGSLLAGTTWKAWRGLELTGQLEANTAVVDTGTDLDGDAVVLTLGGRYRTAAGWAFEFGFSEDLQVNASPDIVFLLGVRHSL